VGNLGRTLLGLVAVALGVLFLLDGADVLDAGTAIDHWWPLAVIALGALQLMQGTGATLNAWLLIAAGAALLLFTTDTVEGDVWNYIWPLAIIAVGLALLTRWRGAATPPLEATGDDTLTATGIFGGPTVATGSQRFHSASLTAIFGGVTLDLRGAMPAAEGAVVTATAAFGGIDILVPRGWNITTSGTPLFGGIEDKTEHSTDAPADAPQLHVDALALFGGVDIKHDKH
jgi:hypothetical protein